MRRNARERDGREATKTAIREDKNKLPDGADRMTARELRRYLNDKEALFAEEYLVDLNATQAAIRAGYKPGKDNTSARVQGSKLARDERVRAYRAALIRESVEDKDVTRESIVLKLLDIYRRCMSAEPVMSWDTESHSWVESGVWKFNANGALSALNQLCKLLGFDSPIKIQQISGGLEEFLRGISGGESGGGREY